MIGIGLESGCCCFRSHPGFDEARCNNRGQLEDQTMSGSGSGLGLELGFRGRLGAGIRSDYVSVRISMMVWIEPIDAKCTRYV